MLFLVDLTIAKFQFHFQNRKRKYNKPKCNTFKIKASYRLQKILFNNEKHCQKAVTVIFVAIIMYFWILRIMCLISLVGHLFIHLHQAVFWNNVNYINVLLLLLKMRLKNTKSVHSYITIQVYKYLIYFLVFNLCLTYELLLSTKISHLSKRFSLQRYSCKIAFLFTVFSYETFNKNRHFYILRMLTWLQLM